MSATVAGSELSCNNVDGQSAAAIVASAEAAVADAAQRKALWTVAVDALTQARISLRSGACAQAIQEAEAAMEFSRLGIDQLEYPPYRIP